MGTTLQRMQHRVPYTVEDNDWVSPAVIHISQHQHRTYVTGGYADISLTGGNSCEF